ncbi:MAG: phosphate propanoyltransferase [Armatimonadetes bacterium]|nr:phosphate propanoyltransferase [Armatimonadota bacterium]
MGIAAQLSDHPLLAGFAPQDVTALCSAGEVKDFEAGETIIRSGEAGTHLGIVLDGRVQVVGEDDRGRPRRYAELGPSSYFGEISLISGEPTTADVRALIPSRVLLIPHDAFSEALNRHPQALQQLARTVSQRLRAQIALRAAAEAVPAAEPTTAASAGSSTAELRVLVLACGTDRLSYSYFDTEREFHNREGSVTGLGGERAEHVQAVLRGRTSAPVPGDLPSALEAVLRSLEGNGAAQGGARGLSAIAHRLVCGGERHDRAASVDETLIRDLRNLSVAGPELGASLDAIEACRRLAPEVPQIAVFDTAFFQSMSPAAFLQAVPYELYRTGGLRRYGRHGLAHHQAALLAADHLEAPPEELRLVVCHLDRTTSLCAIGEGRAVDVSDALPNGGGLPGPSSVGELDPGVVFRIARQKGLSLGETERLLTQESGLLGLSGLSGDLRELATATDSRAALALDVWAYALRKHIGAYVAALGGLDALVFTGPYGETESALRARACEGLQGLGLELDPRLNQAPEASAGGASDISAARSSARILLVSTDECRMAASEALSATGHPGLASLFRRRRQPIPIAISAHHVHLRQDHVEALYGPAHTLNFRSELSQPGQFACEETVTLVGGKGKVERVRVLGPVRPQTQVEISRTEEFQLGIDAPIRASGDLAGSPGIRIEGPQGAIDLQEGTICAARHVHMSPEDALRFRVRDKDRIAVRVEGARPISFGEVLVRVHPDFRLDMHVDTDEGNAAELDRDAVGYLEAVER